MHSRTLCCTRSAVLVLGATEFLHVLFNVSLTDMPEHGTGTCRNCNTNAAKHAQHNVQHILPRACQPMRKQSRSCARSTDSASSQTSYESARTAEARLPDVDIPKRD